jgi:hypothetical protein
MKIDFRGGYAVCLPKSFDYGTVVYGVARGL